MKNINVAAARKRDFTCGMVGIETHANAGIVLSIHDDRNVTTSFKMHNGFGLHPSIPTGIPSGRVTQTNSYRVCSATKVTYRAMHEMPIELAEQVPAPLSDDEVKDFQERLPGWITAKERRILILYYCYGYSQREISTIVGLTYNAVRARITRLHIKLREHGFDELNGFN